MCADGVLYGDGNARQFTDWFPLRDFSVDLLGFFEGFFFNEGNIGINFIF